MKLKCDLTAEELETRRDKLLTELETIDALTEEKKETTKEISTQIKGATQRAFQCREAIRRGYDMREVQITEFRNDEKEVVIKRMDTGEVVSRRPLTDDERQTELVGLDTPTKKDKREATPKTKGKGKGGKGKGKTGKGKDEEPDNSEGAWEAAKDATGGGDE